MQAQSQSWQETARAYGLSWKSVAGILRRAVECGLDKRRHKPLHWMGIDEGSRQKGNQYLTIVYDLESRVLVWSGEDRTEQALAKFFAGLGARLCATVRVVCMDMWVAYAKSARRKLPNRGHSKRGLTGDSSRIDKSDCWV